MPDMPTSPDAAPYFPLPDGYPFCKVIPGFLSPQECAGLVAESEERGFARADSDYPPSYRNNDRQVLDSPELASRMWQRLQGLLPPIMQPATAAPSQAPWTLDSINERFRFCRYRAGQRFEIHQDGVHHRSRTRQSCLTFLLYLSDGDACEGGDTLFYDAGPASAAPPVARVRPRAGSLIVFDHRLWHAGEQVASGIKYILRSDVLYRDPGDPGDPGASPHPAPRTFEPGHQGYVWTLEALDDDTFASGGRDTSIRVWRRDGSLLGALQGHTRSVLGLARLPGGRLASVSRDRSLRIWDWRSGSCVQAVEQAHAAAVLGVIGLEAGAIATSGADRVIQLWDAHGGHHGSLAGHRGWVWCLDRMPDGLLASASEDGAVRIWDPARAACLHVLPGDVALRALAVSGCGRCIVTANIQGELTVWEQLRGAWTRQQSFRAHQAAARRVRWLSGTRLASAGEDNRTLLWTMPGGRQAYVEPSLNFTTDILAMGSGILGCSYDGQIRWLGGTDHSFDEEHEDEPSKQAPDRRSHLADPAQHPELRRPLPDAGLRR
jgi:predicted 2-oxoglutarate/Fe(II)-dependent dioxygenase YbiX